MKLTMYVILASIVLFSCSTTKQFKKTPIGLINNVSYLNPKFNNSNASNGFLVTFNSKTYAITAKHVLMIAKTDKMKFVDFENELKQWKMHPKNDTSKYVLIDKLLNKNRKDSLTWDYMNNNWDTYNDWLVFSVKKNKTEHNPLKFRTSPLKKDESLYAIGWSYKDSIGKQRIYEYQFKKTDKNYYTLLGVKAPKSLGGLSGSPVVDKNGYVVGLVSSGWEDEKTKENWLEITNMKNIIAFLKNKN